MTPDEIRSKALCANTTVTTVQAMVTALEIFQEIAAQLAELNVALKKAPQTPKKPGVWTR